MSRRLFFGVAALVSLVATGPVLAAGHQSLWMIAHVEGAARNGKGDGVWWSVRLGGKVRPGSHIETGAGGTVTLVHGGDSIEIAPDSKLTISPKTEGGQDGILQTLGSLLFRMESRESRDFKVDTPFLAAAIKGTTFVVTVSTDEATVTVDEGSVEVTGAATRDVALIGAGESARVSRDHGNLEVSSGDSRGPGRSRAGAKGAKNVDDGNDGNDGNDGDDGDDGDHGSDNGNQGN